MLVDRPPTGRALDRSRTPKTITELEPSDPFCRLWFYREPRPPAYPLGQAQPGSNENDGTTASLTAVAWWRAVRASPLPRSTTRPNTPSVHRARALPCGVSEGRLQTALPPKGPHDATTSIIHIWREGLRCRPTGRASFEQGGGGEGVLDPKLGVPKMA